MTRITAAIIIFLFSLSGTLFSQVDKSVSAYPQEDYDRVFNEIVLLKNHGSLLPVKDTGVNTIALIGPVIKFPGLGSRIFEDISDGPSPKYLSPLQAISELVGDSIKLLFAPGINMYNDIIRLDSTMVYIGQGVNGYSLKYYNNQKASGSPVAFETGKFIDHYWTGSPHPELDSAFSLSWDAALIPTHGPVKVKLIHSDGCRLSLDGETLIDAWEAGPVRADSAWLNIRKGESYNLRIDFFSDGKGPAVIKFGFDYLETIMMFDALEKAAKADLVIVFTGQTVDYADDGTLQPAYQIPRQSKMIRDIYEVNPKVVVVLQTPTAVDIESWAFDVPAIIQAGSPFINDGRTIAGVLFGRENPYGKLPYRWTMNWNQNFATRFPFGHGLSYSTIGIGKLMMRRNRDASGWTASVEVRNMGMRTGTEVLQLYIRSLNGLKRQFIDEMKTFKVVTLLPEQKKIVSIPLPYDVFRTYDPNNDTWSISPGLYEIKVGVSAEDIKLRKTIEIKEENIKQ